MHSRYVTIGLSMMVEPELHPGRSQKTISIKSWECCTPLCSGIEQTLAIYAQTVMSLRVDDAGTHPIGPSERKHNLRLNIDVQRACESNTVTHAISEDQPNPFGEGMSYYLTSLATINN